MVLRILDKYIYVFSLFNKSYPHKYIYTDIKSDITSIFIFYLTEFFVYGGPKPYNACMESEVFSRLFKGLGEDNNYLIYWYARIIPFIYMPK